MRLYRPAQVLPFPSVLHNNWRIGDLSPPEGREHTTVIPSRNREWLELEAALIYSVHFIYIRTHECRYAPAMVVLQREPLSSVLSQFVLCFLLSPQLFEFRIRPTINPYKPRTSPKISIRTIPTNTRDCCMYDLTP